MNDQKIINVDSVQLFKNIDPLVALEMAYALVDIYRIVRAGQETRANIAASENLITKQHNLDMNNIRLLVELIDKHAAEFPEDIREDYYRAIPAILTKNNIKVEIKLEGKTQIISNYTQKKEFRK